MTNEQKIAIEYFIALVQKYELAGSVVQRGRHPYGIIKSKNDQVEMQFNAERLRWVVNSSIEDSLRWMSSTTCGRRCWPRNPLTSCTSTVWPSACKES